MDVSCSVADLHMRTDANNLVTTAHTTHLPEQQETIHMIQMLRKEAVSGSIEDLGHIRTHNMLADCLTKNSAKPDVLIQAVDTGILPDVDASPSFRSLLKHKAYMIAWLSTVEWREESPFHKLDTFMCEPIAMAVTQYVSSPHLCHLTLLASLENTCFHTSSSELTSDDVPETNVKCAWHSHTCSRCKHEYVHFHEIGESGLLHEDEPFQCCFLECSWHYGGNSDTVHNPTHSRASTSVDP